MSDTTHDPRDNPWWRMNRMFETLASVGIHNCEDLAERWKQIQRELAKKRKEIHHAK